MEIGKGYGEWMPLLYVCKMFGIWWTVMFAYFCTSLAPQHLTKALNKSSLLHHGKMKDFCVKGSSFWLIFLLLAHGDIYESVHRHTFD